MVRMKYAIEVMAGDRVATVKGDRFAEVREVRLVANGTGVEILTTGGFRLPWMDPNQKVAVALGRDERWL